MLDARIEWKVEDMWIGLYWRVGRWAVEGDPARQVRKIDVWICILPCLPIHLIWADL